MASLSHESSSDYGSGVSLDKPLVGHPEPSPRLSPRLSSPTCRDYDYGPAEELSDEEEIRDELKPTIVLMGLKR